MCCGKGGGGKGGGFYQVVLLLGNDVGCGVGMKIRRVRLAVRKEVGGWREEEAPREMQRRKH